MHLSPTTELAAAPIEAGEYYSYLTPPPSGQWLINIASVQMKAFRMICVTLHEVIQPNQHRLH